MCGPHRRSRLLDEGAHPLTEDRLLFDGPRSTYGRFRVLHQVGAGSVGPVFRGEAPDTRQVVAIKVIRVGLPPERVGAVVSALTSVKERLTPHPALARILDVGTQNVEPYVVCEFVDGDSLDVALREYGPAHMRDALPRLRALADALDAAAAMGITHGSLHLRDIVVSPEVTVLTGIGIAPALERVGVRPPVRRPYAAPEVVAGHGTSPASDQYALAAIAHEWLSGRRIAGPGAEGFHLRAETPQATEALVAVFCRALDERPEARFATVSAFVDALSQVDPAALPTPARAPKRRSVSAADTPRLAFEQLDDADPEVAPEPTRLVPPSGPLAITFGDDVDMVAALESNAVRPAGVDAREDQLRDDVDDVLPRSRSGPDRWDDELKSVDDDEVEDDEPDAAAPPVISVPHSSPRVVHAAAPAPAEDATWDDELQSVDDEDDAPEVEDSDDTRAQGGRDLADEADDDGGDDAVDIETEDELPVAASARTSEWEGAEHPGASRSIRRDAPVPAPEVDRASRAPTDGPSGSHWKWGVAGVAVAAMIGVGGLAIVRWGTPRAQSPTASTATSGPSEVVTLPRPTAPVSTRADASTRPASSPAAPPATPAAAPETRSAPGPAAPPAAPPPAAATTTRPTPLPAPKASPPKAPTRAAASPAPAAGAPPKAAARPAPRSAAPPTAKAAASTPTSTSAGRLLVRTTPAGAEVFVNGTRRGVTPLALQDLPLGTHTVRVTRAGFTARESRVTLARGRASRTLDVALQAVRAAAPAAVPAATAGGPGSLLIESRPPGARVWVDGREVGVTPVTVPALSAGEHGIRVQRDGFLPITTAAIVTRGQRARVGVSLTAQDR